MTIFFLLTVICNHFAYVLLFLYKSAEDTSRACLFGRIYSSKLLLVPYGIFL
jgi:hypothetical protein